MAASIRWRPRLEALEDRAAPTALGGPGPAGHHGLALAAPSGPDAATSRLSLAGRITGTFTGPPVLPDASVLQVFAGSGTVAPLGLVQASGSLALPGFIAGGHAQGSITLANSQGTVTFELLGPLQPGYSAPPARLRYTVTGGTGAYAGATGHGWAFLHESHVAGGAGNFRLLLVPALT